MRFNFWHSYSKDKTLHLKNIILYTLQRTEVCYVETFCKSCNEGKIWSNPDPNDVKLFQSNYRDAFHFSTWKTLLYGFSSLNACEATRKASTLLATWKTPRKKRLSESSDRRRLLNPKVTLRNTEKLLGQFVNTGYKTSSRVFNPDLK